MNGSGSCEFAVDKAGRGIEADLNEM